MRVDDLAFVSAEETAALVRTGDATPREVVEAALRRIEALEPALNAFIEIDGERALAEADGVVPGDAAPFAGVPIAIKGNTPVEGWELNSGSRFLAGQRPDHSAYLVRRLREAGLRRRRDHEPARVRDPADHRAAPHRPDPQPVGPRSHAGRIVRRRRGGGRVRDAPDRARQRRRRLDPDSRLVLRPRRPQAQPRARLARARTSATPGWPATAS